MRLSHPMMYGRLLASDPAYNGRFFAGVMTTGIYCLPSCKARKPERNVRFFPSCEAARAQGLRPCLKCHPDDFEKGADPVMEVIEAVAKEVRNRPGDFPDSASVVRRTGFGATRAFELFRLHYQRTPAALLLESRIEAAKAALIGGKNSLVAVAGDAGFESLSSFHEHIRERTGLSPSEYRRLPASRAFRILLPKGYPLAYLFRALERDPQSPTERKEGNAYALSLSLPAGPAVVELRPAEGLVDTALVHSTGPAALSIVQAHRAVANLLGLGQDAGGFARLAARLGFRRLVAGRTQMRIIQTPGLLEGLTWSIIGQQINFAFACTLRRRLIEKAGLALPGGLLSHPTADALASVSEPDLRAMQFSRQKADYLLSTVRLIAAGHLDLALLETMSATRVERTLINLRGLGPWSVNYVMMRSLGFADCVPLGDTGVSSGLQSLLGLDDRPDIDATRRLMQVFSPYRSLATAHLWQFNKPRPEASP